MRIIRISCLTDEPPEWWTDIIDGLKDKHTQEPWGDCALNVVTEFLKKDGARYVDVDAYTAIIEFDDEADYLVFKIKYGL